MKSDIFFIYLISLFSLFSLLYCIVVQPGTLVHPYTVDLVGAPFNRILTRFTDVRLCENYEADVNGTAIGWFECPFPFEPSSYTVCCGDRYAEFCCQPEYESSRYYSSDSSYKDKGKGNKKGKGYVVIFGICVKGVGTLTLCVLFIIYIWWSAANGKILTFVSMLSYRLKD